MADTEKQSSVGYKEKSDALSIRIEAHKNFSNFKLEDWLSVNLPFREGGIILDIGCGSGNMFSVYSGKLGATGVIVGIDQSKDLLAKAATSDGPTPKVLLEFDMNNKLLFLDESFDNVISTFAIYYVEDVKTICKEIKRVLKFNGEILLIGPTENNARELYDFNEMVFGFGRDEKITKRTNRIEKEFFVVLHELLGNATLDIIPSKLVFPSKEDFLKYYTATLLYEESLNKADVKPDMDFLSSIDIPILEISKEMIVVRSKKNG